MADSPRPDPLAASDARLMEGVARGDRGSFGELVERHHQRALDLAYRLSGDPELARDVAQESFLRILKAAPRYESRAPFPVFLTAIVRNLVRETARKRRRRREDPLPEDPIDDADAQGAAGIRSGSADPLESLHRAEVRERLLRALGSIGEKAREVFVLSEMEGFSYQEIARICRCPIGTVASRKHDAMVQLRAILRPLRDGGS